MTSRRITLLFALALAAGCVEDAKNAADGGSENLSTGPLLPWKVGNRWTYRVTDKGVVSEKTTTIEAEEAVGGTGPSKDVRAFRVNTLKDDGTDQTISWQGVVGDKVVRYREQALLQTGGELELEEHWAPYKLHIDGSAEHVAADAKWVEAYEETKILSNGTSTTASQRDAWAVDQADATVTVPAGTFEHAIVFTKAGGTDLKMYWYVRGVGKVKETGGQTEELESYQVTP